MTRLESFRSDMTSQCGEDGMIAELTRRLAVEKGWCVELGAWDGKYLSNTWSLWNLRGWSAVLIEGDEARARSLANSNRADENIYVINAYVEADGPRSLDGVLSATPLPAVPDLLSLDIDGDDYHVWKGLTRYRPRIVLVEYNASFPVTTEFVQRRGESIGSSAAAMTALAREKGYTLMAATPSNLVFLTDEEVPKVDLDVVAIDEVFPVDGLPIVYSDFHGHHYVLRAGQWGYQATTPHAERTLRAATREAIVVARRLSAERVPALARAYRRVRRGRLR